MKVIKILENKENSFGIRIGKPYLVTKEDEPILIITGLKVLG